MRFPWTASRARKEQLGSEVAAGLLPAPPTGSLPEVQPEAAPEGVPGAVWLEAGVLRVRNPEGLGRWPTVALDGEDAGVDLVINGVARTGEVVVQEADRVALRARREEQPGRIAVEIAPDGMSVWVTVHPGRRTVYTLPDVPPAPHLALRALRRDEPLATRFWPADVRAALRAEGVFATPDEEAVQQALRAPGTRVLVARGRPPRPGRPASIWTLPHGELSAPPDPTLVPLRQPDDAAVTIGTPLAKKMEVAAGEELGKTVRGEAVAAGPAWRPDLVAGPGAMVSADGRTVIATASGHAAVEVRGEEVYASVSPELGIPGNVDETRGDPRFDGDIWVGGDIESGRTVTASGNVEVTGRVFCARIEAGGSICVGRDAAQALLIAGGPGLCYARVIGLCEELARAATRAGAQPVAALAFRIHKELAGAGVRLHPEVRALLDQVGRLTGSGSGLRDGWNPAARQSLSALAATLAPAIACMRRALVRRGQCVVRSLDQTTVEASGDVVIADAGAVRSSVTALGQLLATGPVRGGTFWALRSAVFGSVGSGPDLPTFVQIGPRARFTAAEVRPGTTVLRGGALVQRFDAVAHDVVLEPAGGEG